MDRQDIDALLIGALYSELTPADEARLAAHLESHPADRGALDDLKSARQAVRESRIFDVQADPPQAVSALLLQEAHRRAPKRVISDDGRESWFARFTRAFIAHPAMAAAAMLVLVVGVASTLYLRKGDLTAMKEAQPQTVSTPTAVEPPSAAANDRAAGSGYEVKLEDNVEPQAEPAREKDVAPTPPAEHASQPKRAEPAPTPAKVEPTKKAAATKGIPVQTKSPTVKELGEAEGRDRDRDDAFDYSAASNGAAAGRGAGVSPGAAAPAPPPPAVDKSASIAPTTPAPPVAAPKSATVTNKPTTEKPADGKAEATDPSLLAWAKGQHNTAIAAVRNNDCRRAAALALAVSNRAPDYYAQFMATDRALKGCQTYITQELDRDAEKSGKSRAQKKATHAR